MLALLAKLRVLGVPEPRLWINPKYPDNDDDTIAMRYIPITDLTENEARRNWLTVQHEIAVALKRHKRGKQ